MWHAWVFKKSFSPLEDKTTARAQGYKELWSATNTNTISASGSQHQLLVAPDSFLPYFCHPKEPEECWATAHQGKKHRTCSSTPHTCQALVSGALQSRDSVSPGRHRDLLQGSPTKLSWPHHSTYNFMMHSQELKGFFCLKKESQCPQRAALAAGTDIAVSLFNRWPGSHIANQVTHSEGISQMISYHVKFQPPKGFWFLISENRFKETCWSNLSELQRLQPKFKHIKHVMSFLFTPYMVVFRRILKCFKPSN